MLIARINRTMRSIFLIGHRRHRSTRCPRLNSGAVPVGNPVPALTDQATDRREISALRFVYQPLAAGLVLQIYSSDRPDRRGDG